MSFSMQDSQKARQPKEAKGAVSDKAAPPVEPGKRTLIAVAVGAIALATVMTLMLVTAWLAPAQQGETAYAGGRRESPAAYADRIRVEKYSAKVQKNSLGSNALSINGYVTNSGARTVAAADLRCYFVADDDARSAQAYYDFPLVIETSLDDLGDGPLRPMSGRKFAVRMGDFPGGSFPSISRVEVINVRLKKG
jgi:hypothetical protein